MPILRLRPSYLLFLCVILFSQSGCSPQQIFDGPSKKKAEVAIVRGWGVQLLSVNDVQVGINSTGVVVLPGSNRFEIVPNASNYHDVREGSPPLRLEMRANAGVEYAITSKRGEGRICAFPLNPTTGDPIFEKASGCASR